MKRLPELENSNLIQINFSGFGPITITAGRQVCFAS